MCTQHYPSFTSLLEYWLIETTYTCATMIMFYVAQKFIGHLVIVTVSSLLNLRLQFYMIFLRLRVCILPHVAVCFISVLCSWLLQMLHSNYSLHISLVVDIVKTVLRQMSSSR